MGSFTQTWHKLIKPLRKKKSMTKPFQPNLQVASTSSKTVRFYEIDEIFYTHSSFDYDRTPVAELFDDYYDEYDEYDEDDDEEEYDYENNNNDYTNEYNENYDEDYEEEEEEFDLPVTPTMNSTTQFDYHHIEPSIPINFLHLKTDDQKNIHDQHHMIHGTTSSSNHSLYENPSLKNVKLCSYSS